MATNPPKPPRSISDKGEPPKRKETKQNLKKPEPGKAVALNFRVSSEFKKNFKIASAMTGITQSELLIQAFNLWTQKNG